MFELDFGVAEFTMIRNKKLKVIFLAVKSLKSVLG
jgi:hypothetical protein